MFKTKSLSSRMPAIAVQNALAAIFTNSIVLQKYMSSEMQIQFRNRKCFQSRSTSNVYGRTSVMPDTELTSAATHRLMSICVDLARSKCVLTSVKNCLILKIPGQASSALARIYLVWHCLTPPSNIGKGSGDMHINNLCH